MPSARNLLAASGGSGGKPPLPTYPTFQENQESVLHARELTWIDDDIAETENTYRDRWRGELVTVRYPYQNIAISFYQSGQEYTNYEGTRLIAQVFDYRDPLSVVESGPQDVLDLSWWDLSNIDDPTWSSHLDVVNFGDRLLATIMYNVDGDSPNRHGLAFCSITLDIATLEVTAHWDDSYRFPTLGNNWAFPGVRTLASDPWGLVVCQLWHWIPADGDDPSRWAVNFLRLSQNPSDANVVDGDIVDEQIILDELDWAGVNLWNSAVDAMDMPPPGERILVPWAQIGIDYYKDDLWVIAFAGIEKRDEYAQQTDFERHFPVYMQMVEITETSFSLVSELRISLDFGDVPAGSRLNDAAFYRPLQWHSYTQHGLAVIDDVAFIIYQDYLDDPMGDYARYARVSLSGSTLTPLFKGQLPNPVQDYTRIEEHWSITKCDGKFVFVSSHYQGDGGMMELFVVGPNGTVYSEQLDTRFTFESKIPVTAWHDDIAKDLGGSPGVRQTFDLQNSKIMPMVLPDADDWNANLFVLSHLDALIADAS